MCAQQLKGRRSTIDKASEEFPEVLKRIPDPPERLYVVGDTSALVPGLAIVGARNATPYGIGCARRFARIAAEKGIVVVSGGARGCDSEAHRGALDAHGKTVAFLGSGCDELYPASHHALFQRIVDAGGAVASEYEWAAHPMPFMFRARNRLIAGLSDAVLIVEAGLPSGTFSTADEALEAGREVLVVPGSITSANSRGANQLLYQGASPIVDDATFEAALFRTCGALARPPEVPGPQEDDNPIVAAMKAEPLDIDALYNLACSVYGSASAHQKLMEILVESEASGDIARHPDGRWGPAVAF